MLHDNNYTLIAQIVLKNRRVQWPQQTQVQITQVNAQRHNKGTHGVFLLNTLQ